MIKDAEFKVCNANLLLFLLEMKWQEWNYLLQCKFYTEGQEHRYRSLGKPYILIY